MMTSPSNKEDTIWTTLSLRDCKAIYRILEHEYISYEDPDAHIALKKISDFIKEYDELDRADSKST